MKYVNGRVVVTGAASGVGLSAFRAIRKAGTEVVAVDLAKMPDELAYAEDVDWICGDVAEGSTWDRVQTALLQRSPDGAHALVACAADVSVAPFLETTPNEWRRLFDINVLGVVRALQTTLPAMIERKHGAVAVVCSVNSFFAEDQLSAYSTAKAALLHVVRSAALENARYGVRINAVCPGAVDTPLLQRHLDSLDDPIAARRAIERRTPTGKIVSPEEVASVLQFLISDEAGGISGAAVVVDGGLTTTYDFDSKSLL